MRLADPACVSAAYALADRELTRALIARLREETVELLVSRAVLPETLLEEVLGSRDPDLIGALLTSATAHRDEVFRRLAAKGDPALAGSLYGGRAGDRTTEQRLAVWEGAAATVGDPGWRAADGLPARLMGCLVPELLEPALLSPFPELAAHARRVLDAQAELAERAARAASRSRTAGSAADGSAVKGLAVKESESGSRAWRRWPKTTEELVADLRDSNFSGTIYPPSAPGALDWDALLAEHRATPFAFRRLPVLWTHPHCAEGMARTAFEPVAGTSAGTASALTGSALESANEMGLAALLRPGITSGAFPVDRVLAEVAPARKVLCALPDDHKGVRAALAAQAARLGADFAPWRAVFTLLPRFPGSVTELIDAALAETPKHLGKTWPKPLGPEFPSRRQANGRAAWLRLYNGAGHEVRCALGEHMDVRAIQQLLLWHKPSPELRAHLVRVRGVSVLAGLADWETPPEVIAELIAYNDPEINAALFLHSDLTLAQRRHVLSGRRLREGEPAVTPAADRLPLTEALVGGVRESARRPWLLACADSGHPLLCRVLLGSPRAKMHTPALELRMLVRLWEDQGPDAVRELLDETDFPGRRRTAGQARQPKHPLSPNTLKAGRAALESARPESSPEPGPAPSPGPASGLDSLRAAERAAAGPAGRAEFLAEKGAGTGDDDLEWALDLLTEEIGPAPVPWAELVAGHGVKPLHDRLLVRLAELDGCPPALVDESAGARLRLSHPEYRPRRGAKPPTASEMLAKLPLRVDNGGCRWLEGAYELGQLTLPEVVESGFPARATVPFLARVLTPAGGADPGAPESAEIRDTRRALAALAAEHLANDPEGWTLALRLIPEFEGPLPDLLLASGAVVA
ncbi:hypothetical protein OG875_14760 [Streptomyces sp. NBC_01498]|uniref:hypothetical protein n=1 Tax=Streptomyces sp. NBC_01498 TaxID=2975870 RepID=UPI002E7B2F8C|nr:hypothetical protein [Streptomyces sp. NBC_01498]WTL25749.1 hypothetical protein OG875_14760 [Streptomyces sp. NBC_01498]